MTWAMSVAAENAITVAGAAVVRIDRQIGVRTQSLVHTSREIQELLKESQVAISAAAPRLFRDGECSNRAAAVFRQVLRTTAAELFCLLAQASSLPVAAAQPALQESPCPPNTPTTRDPNDFSTHASTPNSHDSAPSSNNATIHASAHRLASAMMMSSLSTPQHRTADRKSVV